MESRLLLSEGDYSIRRYQGIPPEAIMFLDSISWGNEGAVYEHKNTEEQIAMFWNPTLIAILENDKIRGTAVFCNTPVLVGYLSYNAYYIRYFASSQEIRGKGVMKDYSVKVMESIRQEETGKTIFFATIEKGNKGSYRVVERAGYRNIGLMKTNGFSRFFPVDRKNYEQVKTDDVRRAILTILREYYQAHSLVQFNSLFQKDNYFVIREKGEIIAGCQYHRVHWVVNQMPGLSGKLLLNIVPHIPILNKLFNPKRFEFLAFEGIFAKAGKESRLAELFESLLARENLRSAVFWMAENCPVRRQIIKNINLGLIHSFVKDSDAFIMASFHDLNEEEITAVMSGPIYASAFDYI